MKRTLLLLLFSLLVSLSNYSALGQTIPSQKLKIANDSNDIIGKWIHAYDKMENGKTIIINKDSVDTLDFYSNHKYLWRQEGLIEKASWILHVKFQAITLYGREVKTLVKGKYLIENPKKIVLQIGEVTKDTLVFFDFKETSPWGINRKKYYIKSK